MKHYYKKIKGWFDAAKLYRNMVRDADDGALFVELGSYLGKSTSCMAVEIINSGKNIRFDSIDLFEGDTGSRKTKADVANRDGSMIEAKCRENLSPVSDYVNIIKGDAIELADAYEDNSIDFLYVDDYHETEHVYKELVAWWPKIKAGGVLAGDDYVVKGNNGMQVIRAVDRFTEGTDLEVLKPRDLKIKGGWRINKPQVSKKSLLKFWK